MSGGAIQRERFREGEGDAYFARNDKALCALETRAKSDLPLRLIRDLGLAPRRVLEVGAGTGWRLADLSRDAAAPWTLALEPSRAATGAGQERYPAVTFARASAEALPVADGSFDLVVLGFFLYLVDRRDLFAVASECDRVLADGGALVLLDFFAERPHKNVYAAQPDLFSYKMDYRKMFLWNPAYREWADEISGAAPVAGNRDGRLRASVLRKESAEAYADASLEGSP